MPASLRPSTTNAGHAVQYFDTMVQVPHVLDYLTDLSYHRYSGVSDQVIADIGARATQYGVRTSMLEHIGSGYEDLYQDVSVGRNSAWSEFALAFCDKPDDGGKYYNIDLSNPVESGRAAREPGEAAATVLPLRALWRRSASAPPAGTRGSRRSPGATRTGSSSSW